MSVILPSATYFENLPVNVNKKTNFKIVLYDQTAALSELCLYNQSVAFCSWSYSSWFWIEIFIKKLCKSLYTPAVNPNQLGFCWIYFSDVFFTLQSWHKKRFCFSVCQSNLAFVSSTREPISLWASPSACNQEEMHHSVQVTNMWIKSQF